ncbi:unnamed protein product [Linum tenue]|uniref:Uncharacterized protein n=1 Tax=Linum tenue TaxID=586396 RepID=A0AAV0MLP3_9ROSI|nr:unnamed protein product [Linum tenue]
MAASSYLSHLLYASIHPQPPAKSISLGFRSSTILGFQGSSSYPKRCYFSSSVKSNGISRHARVHNISCSINMAAGKSDDPERINLRQIVHKGMKLWGSCPEPVRSFPWNTAFNNFIQLLLDLTVTVVKYLAVPLLLITTLSEMSYCAHHKKLVLITFPLLIGFAVAGFLRDSAFELSPSLKDAEVPWHLIAIAAFFALIKLPGPYYPFWGRIFIPHMANGVLWRTLWFGFMWNRRPRNGSGEQSFNPVH